MIEIIIDSKLHAAHRTVNITMVIFLTVLGVATLTQAALFMPSDVKAGIMSLGALGMLLLAVFGTQVIRWYDDLAENAS